MAPQIVNLDKLAEAQEAADAAVAAEAAMLAAEKVEKVRSGDDLTAPLDANREEPAKTHGADVGGMADGYQVIRNGPEDFSVEGFFCRDGSQRFLSAKGFPTEAAARQWVYDQLADDKPEGRP